MRRLLWSLLLALFAVTLVTPADALGQKLKPGPLDKLVDGDKDKDECKNGCARHGTKIDFYKTPSDAAAAAKKEEKLVLVLHVSGVFEDPKFT